MKLLFKLGWRNIWRNKRRSLLTILAVTFAALLALVMRGMQVGTYEANIRNVVRMFSGYMQIQRLGYQKNPALPLSFPYDEKLKALLREHAAITGYSPRVQGDGLVSFKENALGVMILGIAQQTEREVSNFHRRTAAGRFFASDSSDEIVVGYKLLQNLKAKLGDRVVILAQGADGSLSNMKYRICGAIKTGAIEFDGMGVFMGLAAAQELLVMENRVHVVVLSLNNLNAIAPLRRSLHDKLLAEKLTAISWEEVLPEFKSHIQMDNLSGIFFLAILIVIVAFGILNTVLMSVTERFREFGVVLAMGMPQNQLVLLVFIETLFITIVGLIVGNLLAAVMNYYIVLNPITLGGDLGTLYEEFGFMPRLESTVRLHVFVNSSLGVLFISFLSCLYPAHRVYKLEPLKGLRYT